MNLLNAALLGGIEISIVSIVAKFSTSTCTMPTFQFEFLNQSSLLSQAGPSFESRAWTKPKSGGLTGPNGSPNSP